MNKRLKPTELGKHIKEMPDMQKLLHKRRRFHRIVRIIIAVAATALVVGVFIFLHDRRTQIYTIEVSGNEITDTSAIVANIQKSLSGSYLYVVPKTTIFFYPKSKVAASLKKDFPRFNSIQIALINKNTLLVRVTEERGTALWCGEDTAVLDYKSACYFTDSSGQIIDTAPYYSGNVYVRFYGGTITATDTNPLGKHFVDESAYKKLLAFSQNIASLGFPIKAIRVTAGSDDFFVLDLGDNNTAFVQFRSADDFDTLYSNLKLALTKAELANQVRVDRSNLQYFDLRFTNKVYYRFNDAVNEATSTKKS